MTGIVYLDWPIIAVSLFNAILSLWLAGTVLLNAERRNRGVYMAGAGLLASAAFFVSHTAIVGWLFDPIAPGLEFWWHAGWLPIIVAPFGWYILMLWYAGYWESAADPTIPNPLRRRQIVWLAIASAMLVVLIGLALFTIPSFAQAMYFDFSSIPTLGGIPVLLLVYPAFIVLCIGLALDALIRPGPSHRVLGDLARGRSQVWLIGASATLLVVSLLVTAAILWGVSAIVRGAPIILTPGFVVTVAWFDLAAAALIGIAIIFLGQAIVAYEVFTGKALPRRGFFRNWTGALFLAAGYGIVAGGSVVARLRPIYGLLLSAALMTAFYALFNWRSFVERDQFMKRLRPFVGGQGLIDQFTGATDRPQTRASQMFQALCGDVLGAQRARLFPLGSMASLISSPLVYPPNGLPEIALPDPERMFPSPAQNLLLRLPPAMTPFRWAIPLWTERGLIGALVLANKQDGGLYTEEEIEIARASAEGIIDMLGGDEIARRLMDLQRRRLAESQVMDRRAHRMLHDEILPGLHAALLNINALPHDNENVRQAIATLTEAHQRIAGVIHSAAAAPAEFDRAGLLPDAISQLIRAEFTGEFDDTQTRVAGQPAPLDSLANEVAFYAVREAIRNAALHARDPDRPLRLEIAFDYDDHLQVTIADDGVGLGPRLAPDPRSPGAQGGLALHSTLLAIIGGSLEIVPRDGGGACVMLQLPLPRSTA